MVIATVFLTIIGLTAGFFLGERHRDEKAVASPATEPTQPQQAASPVADLVWCPPATREFAVQHGFPFDLHQVLSLAVAHNGNEFRINRTRLQVRFTSGNVETHWVVAAQ